MDYAALLDQMRQERSALDTAIVAIEVLTGRGHERGAAMNGAPAKAVTSKRTRKVAAPPTNGAGTPPDLPARARALWDAGKAIKEIAADLGKPYATVYGWKARDKWPKQKPTTEGGPRRRCDECNQTGTADPCEHCGEPR